MKQLVHALLLKVYRYMVHLGSLESTQEAQFLVLSKLIACIII